MTDEDNPVITALAELIQARCPEGHAQDHPFRVSFYAQTDDEVVVALAHDLIEDDYATWRELQDLGLTLRQLDAVYFLTRQRRADGEYALPYAQYIDNIVHALERGDRGAKLAATVKMYDLFDHVHPHGVAKIKDGRIERYGEAITTLGKAIAGAERGEGSPGDRESGEGAGLRLAA